MLVLERGTDNGVHTRSTYSDEKQLRHILRLRTWEWVEIDALLSADGVLIGKYFFRLYRGVEMPGTRIREVAPQSYDELLTADDRKFVWAMGVSMTRDQRGEEGHDRGSERWEGSAGRAPGGREGCVYRSKHPAKQELTPSLRMLMGSAYEQEGNRNVS